VGKAYCVMEMSGLVVVVMVVMMLVMMGCMVGGGLWFRRHH
jgi:hypothetical protein